MKANLNQKFFGMLVVTLFLGTMFEVITNFVEGKAPSITDNSGLTYSSNTTDEDQIKVVLDDYFNLRYENQRLLSPVDYTSIIADPFDTKWLQTEIDRAEVAQFQGKIYKMNYLTYKFYLDYKKIEIDGLNAVVELLENNEVMYETSAPRISKMGNLRHFITLIKNNGNWRLVSDEYEDEIIKGLRSVTKEQIMDRIQNYRINENILPPISPTPTQDKVGIFTPDFVPCDYTRSDAVWYASQYYQTYNSNYVDHTDWDCTNFVSQAIVTGTDGIMSTGRNYNTDWYYTNDGSLPWISVPDLYSFLINNSGTGPFGSQTTQCNIQQADVIQGKKNGAWDHAVLIDALDSGYCNDLSKIYYSGHDSDRYDEPATTLLNDFSELRFIRITGCRQ